MQEIADQCGVSKMTVSRALNSKESGKLNEKTLEKINKLAKKYGYVKNLAAKRLTSQKTDTIMLMMGVRPMLGPETTPYLDTHHEVLIWDTVRGVVSTTRKYGYDVKLDVIFERGKGGELLKNLKPQFIDGIIFNSAWEYEKIISHVQSEGIPYVIMSEQWGTLLQNRLCINDSPAFKSAVECLYGKGHRQIAFAGSLNKQLHCKFITNELKKHFKDKCILNNDLFFNVEDDYEVRRLMNSLGKEPPFTALFCMNDSTADIAVRELRYMGLKVPEDIAVVGYDGNRTYRMSGTDPATIDRPRTKLAEMATEILIEMIENKDCKVDFPVSINSTFYKGKTA